MTGYTPSNYREKLRRPEPRSLLASLLHQAPVSQSPSTPILVSPTTTSSISSTTAASSSTSPSTSTSSSRPSIRQMSTPMPHIKLPQFSGTENAQTWWDDFVNFSNFFSYNDVKKCQLIPFYLEGAAKLWYQNLPEGDRLDITKVKEAFTKRFMKSSAFDVSLLQLAQEQEESIYTFITRVETATIHLKLPASVIVAIAVNGLRSNIRQWVYNKEPTNLQEVRHQAELAQKSLASVQSSEVNMMAKVDHLSSLVATLISKTEAPAVQAASPAPQASYQQQQQQQQPRYQPHESCQRQRPRLSNQLPPPFHQAQQQRRYSQYEQHQQRPRFTPPPFLQQRCLGCGSTWSLMILWLLTVFAHPVFCASPVQRLNYGIVYQPTSKVHFATEYWVHTYEVKIPAVPGIPTMSGCHQGNSTCALLNQIQMHLNVIKTKCVSQLNETRQQLMQLIPESKTLHQPVQSVLF
ncbi:uncharacterized protein LOC124124993 [Haliotis rufescens]|uniref:uncharacterized protein LOC124124993 n=1 Tax=Haliotis rufescens TaxID=6454 RepID=UPI00201EE143|nr:uncharacterized protein LOC124124993 [Haliotis rufescens]